MSEQKSTATASAPAKATASYRLPSNVTMKHAARLSINDDKPIMMDYWYPSLEKKAILGLRENGEKLLVKNEDEYTSTIKKFYRAPSEQIKCVKCNVDVDPPRCEKCAKGPKEAPPDCNEYIIITENSIYLVDGNIPNKKIY